jgi:hypothetical protein
MPITLDPSSSGGAAGYYADQGDVEDVFGVTNIATYSNLENDATTADANRIQLALDGADDEINDFFRGGPLAVPLPINSVTTDWAATLAGEWLYRSRGLRDDDKQGNHVTELARAARREMGMYKCEVKRFGTDASRVTDLPQMPTAPC